MFAINKTPKHNAVTERSPAYAILAIDSEDRFTDYNQQVSTASGDYNGSPYDFQITKSESLMNGFFTRLAVTEINFPWVIPNISDRTNTIGFEYQVGAGPIGGGMLTLPIGFLKPSDIAAQLQALIRAFDPPNLGAFTMTYGQLPGLNPYPGFSYATNNPGVTFAFLQMAYNSDIYPFPPTVKQLFNVLGFSSENTEFATNEAGFATFAQTVRYVDIVCSQLTYNQALKDTMSQTIARDTLCRIYLGDGPYTGTSTMSPNDASYCPPGCAPFTIYRQFTNPKFIRWLPNQPVPGTLRFQVYDDNGELLDNSITEGAVGLNWSMTLLVSED